jgi:hypothetical protein
MANLNLRAGRFIQLPPLSLGQPALRLAPAVRRQLHVVEVARLQPDDAAAPDHSVRVWNYGLSTFDRAHVLKVNWLYDLPAPAAGNSALRWITNDWQISGIYTASTGAPAAIGFSTVNAVDTTGSPTESARIVYR